MADDWRQASYDAARTGYSPTELFPTTGTVQRAWLATEHRDFESIGVRGSLYPQLGPIVSSGHVILCTLQGRVRSYEATYTSKNLQWTRQIPPPSFFSEAPIIGTPAADATKVYVADLFGRVTAINLADGSIAWGPTQITDGLWANVTGAMLLADGLLMFGATDKKFRFVDPSDGSQPFGPVTLPAEIKQGAAAKDGLVVIGAMDCKLRAFNTNDGTLEWTSTTFDRAAAFKDYYPVIIGNRVIARPLSQNVDNPTGGLTRGITVADFLVNDQQVALDAYAGNTAGYVLNMRTYDLLTGDDQPPPIQYFFWHTMNGAAAPPPLTADGQLVVGVTTPPSNGITQEASWAFLDLATRKLTTSLEDVTQPAEGGGNQDENLAVIACGNAIFAMHCEEGNANKTSAFFKNANPSLSRWVRLSTIFPVLEGFNNTQGGGASVPVISNGLIYHTGMPHFMSCFRRV